MDGADPLVKTLIDLSRVFAEVRNESEGLARMLKLICENLNFDIGLFWRRHETGEYLFVDGIYNCSESHHVLEESSKQIHFRKGEGFPGSIWEEGRYKWLSNIGNAVNFPRLSVAMQEGIRSAFGFPIFQNQAVVGVLEFFSNALKEPDELVLQSFDAIGYQIGSFIERNRVEAALHQNEEKVRLLIETALDAVITINEFDEITEWNSEAARIFGWKSSEVLGKTLTETIIPPKYILAHEHGLKRYLETGEGPILNKRIEITAINRQGVEFPVELAIRVITMQTGRFFSAFLRDISDRRKADEERTLLISRLRTALSEEEKAGRVKDDFLATISHELRTPLTTILGWARLLNSRPLSEEMAKRALWSIERSAEIQAILIDDLLDVSRIIAGKFHLDYLPVSLDLIIQEAVESIRPLANAKNIEVTADPLPEVKTFGDPNRLRQVLWNLLTNAIKFTNERGTISVSLKMENGKALIMVQDTGKGMEEDVLENIFERFRQVETKSTGLGLGLAIVKHIVELHKGTVEAFSEGLKHGSRFLVTLPMSETAQSVDATVKRTSSIECREELDKRKILIVEDDPESRELFTFVLSSCGAEIAACSSVKEAFSIYSAAKQDLLICDISLPNEQGDVLLKRIRALNDPIPAIALTAYGGDKDRQNAMEAGFDRYVVKPVDPDLLIQIAAETFRKSATKKL